MEVKGIIFDWAGTLVDYGCMAPTQVFIEVFKDKGIEISMEEARGPMGLAKRDHVKELLALDSVQNQWKEKFNSIPVETDLDELYNKLEPKLADIVDQFANVIPGVIDFCNTMREKGVKLGSTTGYVGSMMEKIIPLSIEQGLNLDSIVTSSDKSVGRPFPWMIYENAERMNVYPMSSMIKIGDTVADIHEGLNAGMWTIGITKSGNEVGYDEEGIKSVDSVTLIQKMKAAEAKLNNAGAHFIAESVADCYAIVERINELIKEGVKP